MPGGTGFAEDDIPMYRALLICKDSLTLDMHWHSEPRTHWGEAPRARETDGLELHTKPKCKRKEPHEPQQSTQADADLKPKSRGLAEERECDYSLKEKDSPKMKSGNRAKLCRGTHFAGSKQHPGQERQSLGGPDHPRDRHRKPEHLTG